MAICVCWWHTVTVTRKMKRGKESWTFSPCATLRSEQPIGGWMLTNAKGPGFCWIGLHDEPIKVPVEVQRLLRQKVRNVREIRPYPGGD